MSTTDEALRLAAALTAAQELRMDPEHPGTVRLAEALGRTDDAVADSLHPAPERPEAAACPLVLVGTQLECDPGSKSPQKRGATDAPPATSQSVRSSHRLFLRL